jgi:hypothetical protein
LQAQRAGRSRPPQRIHRKYNILQPTVQRVVRRYDCNIAMASPLCNAIGYHTGPMCAPNRRPNLRRGVGLAPATSAPGLGSHSATGANARFRRIRTRPGPGSPTRARPCHVCTGGVAHWQCAGTARPLGSLSAGRFKTAAWLALPTCKSHRDVKPASAPQRSGVSMPVHWLNRTIASAKTQIRVPDSEAGPDPPGGLRLMDATRWQLPHWQRQARSPGRDSGC